MPQHFRIDRIQGLTLLAQTFSPPADFDARAYLETTFQDTPQVQARLRFAPHAAHVALANRAGWEACQEEPDGSVLVTLAAPDLNWLASLVMSFATLVEVLDPPELRSLVREWALGTAALYAESDQAGLPH